MGREDHLNKIEYKLNSKVVIDDPQSLWEELEPRLPKKKKNRAFIFWFSLIGFLLIGLLGLYIQKSDQNTSDIVVLEEGSASASLKPSSSSSVSSSASASSSSSSSSSSSASSSSSLSLSSSLKPTSTSTSNTTSKPNSNSNSNSTSTSKPNSNLTPKFHQESSPQNLINITRSTDQNFTEVHTAKDKEVRPAIVSQTNTSTYDENLQVNHAKSNNSNQKLLAQTEQNPLAEVSKMGEVQNEKEIAIQIIEQPTVQQRTTLEIYPIDRLDLLIPIESGFQALESILTGRHLQGTLVNCCQAPQWQFTLGLRTNAIWNIMDQTNHSDYGQTLDDLTTPVLGYSYGGEVKLQNKSGLFFGLRMEQNVLQEKFQFENSYIVTETILNEEAFLFEGQFIAEEQQVTKTISQKVLHYNEIKSLNINPFLGYGLSKGKLNYGASISPIIMIEQKGTGYLIDEESVLISDLSQFYNRTKPSLTGYHIEAHVSRSIHKKFNMGLQFNYQKRENYTAPLNQDFSLQANSIGIGIHLQYILQ